jgi:tetratricopeptide (TPR) repeat protein
MKIQYILILLLSAVATMADDAFQQGIAAYENSEYAAANSAFETALEANETAAAHHNRALALYQEGKPGQAAWHLERALLLEPMNESYHYKLGALRQQLGLNTAPPEWYALASRALSQQGWIILLGIAFWSTLAALWLPSASGYQANLPIKVVRAIGLLGLLAACTALYLNRQLPSKGIVLSETPATLHAAPAAAAPQTGLARPGERGQQIDQYGDYIQIKTEGGSRGWIRTEHYRLILAHSESLFSTTATNTPL